MENLLSLEDQKEAIIDAFKEENPELYHQLLSILESLNESIPSITFTILNESTGEDIG